MFEQLRLKIISLYKEKAENEIMSGFKTSFEKKRDVNLGLANGLYCFRWQQYFFSTHYTLCA